MNRAVNPLSRFRHALLLALLAWVVAGASGAVFAANDAAASSTIQASAAWVRQPPPGAAAAGAYLRLDNVGTEDDRLLAVDSAAAERVEIHTMRMVDGMMQMRALDSGLELPAGAAVTLAPGGLHLMLIAPRAQWNPGDEVTMTLHFAHAPEQTVVFAVRALMDGTGMEEHGHHHGH